MRLVRALPPVSLIALALLWPSPAHPQDNFDTMSERFDGLWVLDVPRARAERTVDRAVEQAANSMNLLVRQVARPLLRANTFVNYEIELRFRSNNRIFVRFDQRARYTSTVGRTRVVQTPEGDPLNLTQRFRGETLEQVYQADQGTRWNVYTMLDNGRMRVDATTQADMMPQPMHFALTYRRR